MIFLFLGVRRLSVCLERGVQALRVQFFRVFQSFTPLHTHRPLSVVVPGQTVFAYPLNVYVRSQGVFWLHDNADILFSGFLVDTFAHCTEV